MQIYNTLSRRMEEFAPLEAGRVRFYTCGPTVYDYAHIGNYRAYVFEDVLRRTLKHFGWAVTQVMNLTDVDDKTIRGAKAAGVPLSEYTRRYKHAFFADLKTLNVEPAEHYPEATAHVPEMIALVSALLERGYAYRSDDGSVYFRIAAFPEYGKLAHLDREGLRPGARVAQDEYEKDNAADFALWKAWSPEDGDVAWDAPWGRGRPGWHVECSAMSMKYLGESFDLHTGGVDNIFPHHEDEIAQSEAATGKPFVKYWMHCAHLIVEGQKMSKSLGNFHTLRDVLERGYSGREIRYVLLAAHYRQPLNFTFAALDAARAALGRLDEFRQRVEGAAGPAPGVLPEWAAACRARFDGALRQDLNMPEALAALFDMVRAGHRAMDAAGGACPGAEALRELLGCLDGVLGLGAGARADADAEVEGLLARRRAARERKDWAEADRVRARLAAAGWEVRDTADGQKVTRRG
ncbi:MAG: cysteine--tRNA ligase [Lentisphaerae bacterium]|nr:cysteine--tRNA ligase [Lentisphaerota bacterium]